MNYCACVFFSRKLWDPAQGRCLYPFYNPDQKCGHARKEMCARARVSQRGGSRAAAVEQGSGAQEQTKHLRELLGRWRGRRSETAGEAVTKYKAMWARVGDMRLTFLVVSTGWHDEQKNWRHAAHTMQPWHPSPCLSASPHRMPPRRHGPSPPRCWSWSVQCSGSSVRRVRDT